MATAKRLIFLLIKFLCTDLLSFNFIHHRRLSISQLILLCCLPSAIVVVSSAKTANSASSQVGISFESRDRTKISLFRSQELITPAFPQAILKVVFCLEEESLCPL